MPTVIQTKTPSSNSKKERCVGFMRDPVSAVSRPLTTDEAWALHDFEMHARKCAYCNDPYEVHRSHNRLCDMGHSYAQDVARYIYNRPDGEAYSTVEEDYKLVRVEIPAGYEQVRGLLKAIERSIRRSRAPFVSMDRTYHVAPRVPTTPQRSKSVKVEQAKPVKTQKQRPRSGEIVEWPRAYAEVNTTSHSKRGSLYESDLERARLNAPKYRVEVRQPMDRRSGYYHP
ncbi:hypothetical protein BS50DRAFT_480683 [Corynespora cassiicola Philippines]|uniref:Uncharacterized protein n=1 Tax=Corynespora cassiicola Philippines TaxID=1448308 RepID=A0A2T2PCM0_CORCC|nr:hypothetical protein BS50DRAFT_480683 [Corynespora cassiicola Philippines]